MPSSQKLQIWLKPNCTWMFIGWSSTNCTFFVPHMKFKMAATAGLSLTLDPMGKMFQNASSLKPLGQLKPNCPGMIIGRSSTNFLFFMPIGNPIGIKNTHLVEDLPMIIPGQFGFNYPSGFREEAFWNIFPIGSNVKLSPAVAALLNFISEQKT